MILNHFVTKTFFRKQSNREVNGYEALLSRAHRCMRELHRLPNYLTVDFYTPDLMRVAYQLNDESGG